MALSEREELLRAVRRARVAVESLRVRVGWLRSVRTQGTDAYQRALDLERACLDFNARTTSEIEREANDE